MPTPSDNTPHISTNSVEDVSAYHLSCPPETDRIPTWRASSEDSIANNADDGAVPSTATTRPRSTLSSNIMREADDSDAAMIDIETPQPTSGKLAQEDDDMVMESSSPVSVSTISKEEQAMPTMQPPPVSTTPSTPSALDYEFSNVRVSMTATRYSENPANSNPMQSSFQTIRHPSFEPEISLSGRSSRTVRYTMSMWRSSTWIWPSHISADTSEFKVDTLPHRE